MQPRGRLRWGSPACGGEPDSGASGDDAAAWPAEEKPDSGASGDDAAAWRLRRSRTVEVVNRETAVSTGRVEKQKVVFSTADDFAGGSDGSGADQARRWWWRRRRPHRQHGRGPGASREADRGDRRPARRDRRCSGRERRRLRPRIRPKGRTVTWPFRDHLATHSALPGTAYGGLSSFADFLRREAPELLPAGIGNTEPGGLGSQLPHGTT